MPNPSVVLATAGYDHTIRFWEATSGICYRTLQCADSQINRLEITPNKHYLAAAGNPHVRLFEVNSNTPAPILSFEGHTNNVTAVGFQADGKWMYTGSEDGTVKIWDLRVAQGTGCQREFESRAAVNTVVLHPNGNELISGDQNGNIRVWDLTANACSCELVPEVDKAIRSLTVASDGSLVVAANNSGTCYVWRQDSRVGSGDGPGDMQTTSHFEPLHKLHAHDTYILKCLISPNVRYLATVSSDKTIKLWNIDGFTLQRTLHGHQRWVWDCVFSVDSVYLVTDSLAKKTMPSLTKALGDKESLPTSSSRKNRPGPGKPGMSTKNSKPHVVAGIVSRLQDSLRQSGYGEDTVAQLREHFDKLPSRYALDVDVSQCSDVFEHMRLLDSVRAERIVRRDLYQHGIPLPRCSLRTVRLRIPVENGTSAAAPSQGAQDLRGDRPADSIGSSEIPNGMRRSLSTSSIQQIGGGAAAGGVSIPAPLPFLGGGSNPGMWRSANRRTPDGDFPAPMFGSCSNLSALADESNVNAELGAAGRGNGSGSSRGMGNGSTRMLAERGPLAHEISIAGKASPKMLQRLSKALESVDPHTDIREAHMFSTSDHLSLNVFIVTGWSTDQDDQAMTIRVQQALFEQFMVCGSTSQDEGGSDGDRAGSKSGRLGSSGSKLMLPHVSEEHSSDLLEKQRLVQKELAGLVEELAAEDWLLDAAQLQRGERLGSGATGQLYRGLYRGQEVAIKVFDTDNVETSLKDLGENIELFKQEVGIMRQVRHKNVVQFIGACLAWPNLCIVTELMGGGSVADALSRRQGGGLEMPVLLNVLRGVCRGMDFLHKRGIMHRDLKAANVLFDENMVAKVCDFGVSRLEPRSSKNKQDGSNVSGGSSTGSASTGSIMGPIAGSGGGRHNSSCMTAETGTYRWMAPEVIEHKPYDHKADVYSFGIFMWEVVTGEIPYAGLAPVQAAMGVVQRDLRPIIPPNIHPKLAALMEWCWKRDPAARPEFSEVLTVLEGLTKSLAKKGSFMKRLFQ
eukprot:jgi/Mesvir1/22364/Mv17866-RA.1